MTGKKGGVPVLFGDTIVIFQLTELNIKANAPCFQCARAKWRHKLWAERMRNANVRNYLKRILYDTLWCLYKVTSIPQCCCKLNRQICSPVTPTRYSINYNIYTYFSISCSLKAHSLLSCSSIILFLNSRFSMSFRAGRVDSLNRNQKRESCLDKKFDAHFIVL